MQKIVQQAGIWTKNVLLTLLKYVQGAFSHHLMKRLIVGKNSLTDLKTLFKLQTLLW